MPLIYFSEVKTLGICNSLKKYQCNLISACFIFCQQFFFLTKRQPGLLFISIRERVQEVQREPKKQKEKKPKTKAKKRSIQDKPH
jgi:hypothetical protein